MPASSSLKVPALPPEIVHLPYDPGPYRMAMGLLATSPDDLIEMDETFPEQIAERHRLLDTRRNDVLAMPPDTLAASTELLNLLAEALPQRYPGWFARDATALRCALSGASCLIDTPEPLDALGRMVAEDFCLIRPTASGPVLAAAILCFPARWVLAEKLGRPLLDVHERVPGYAERLNNPVNRFFTHLKPGRLAARLNWSVTDDPALFQTTGKFAAARDATITPENAIARLHLRVERQTFLLLPLSGMVSFGIRTHVYPLARVLARQGEAARLAAALRGLPPEMALYKSLGRFRDALLEALDRYSAASPVT